MARSLTLPTVTRKPLPSDVGHVKRMKSHPRYQTASAVELQTPTARNMSQSTLHSKPTALLETALRPPPIAHTRSKPSDRDLLPSQRLRRRGKLPSVWLQDYTEERCAGNEAFFVRPRHPNRNFSFDVGAEVVSLAPTKVDSAMGSMECVREEEKYEEIGKDGGSDMTPPQTFEDILKGMGKSRCVPTALREQ
jgi:hypothetical protein